MNLSRREFLKSSLAAAAGMGALGLLGACSTQENTTSTPSPGSYGGHRRNHVRRAVYRTIRGCDH